MCGIVGAASCRDVQELLMEGLKKLEYRGYDSAGLAVVSKTNGLQRLRKVGKVSCLEEQLLKTPLLGTCGISHTRWATHGKPSEKNAHPHLSSDRIALVHNGIIENYQAIRALLIEKDGYDFQSDTDTEVIVHLFDKLYRSTRNTQNANGFSGLAPIDSSSLGIPLGGEERATGVYKDIHEDCERRSQHRGKPKCEGYIKATCLMLLEQLKGAYALAIILKEEPNTLVGIRRGSPLVIGYGIEENFIASDPMALSGVAKNVSYLEEGDFALITADQVAIFDEQGNPVERKKHVVQSTYEKMDRGSYRHYMEKEIFEQPVAIQRFIDEHIVNSHLSMESFGHHALEIFPKIENIHIIACGTSYHAGLVGKHWFEQIAGIPCQVDIASEYRYRKTLIPSNTLFLTLSQSGETADTLAALKKTKELSYLSTFCICNVAESSLVRESKACLLTNAGPEIGVASTKAFTAQLTALFLLTIVLGQHHTLKKEEVERLQHLLEGLPQKLTQVLTLETKISEISESFAKRQHALFLGRGSQFPIALEGALKLKEISYIHAEAYAAGELKHGPLALIDKEMPVVVVAPNNHLLDKLKSNLHEVKARGGELFVFADEASGLESEDSVHIITVPHVENEIAPIVYALPLQLLAYHAALIKGTDVDQPRNLAKSVTVE